MPLSLWSAFYRDAEAERLRREARLVGIVHARNPRKAQQDLFRAAARILGEARAKALDLLGMRPGDLKRRLVERGAFVEGGRPLEGAPEARTDETPEA